MKKIGLIVFLFVIFTGQVFAELNGIIGTFPGTDIIVMWPGANVDVVALLDLNHEAKSSTGVQTAIFSQGKFSLDAGVTKPVDGSMGIFYGGLSFNYVKLSAPEGGIISKLGLVDGKIGLWATYDKQYKINNPTMEDPSPWCLGVNTTWKLW